MMMIPKGFFLLLAMIACINITAQDTTVTVNKKVVTLKEVVVRNNLNVPSFINRIQNDTSFYKAFRNLKVLEFTSLNDVRMLDKKGNVNASLLSRTQQHIANGCRHTQVLQQTVKGDILNKNNEWNYYTMELYAGLMFAIDTVCGENNIVKGAELNTRKKSGIEKHKEQLKMLFFNPGKKIPGIPFIGDKIAIFDEDVAKLYDFVIDMENYNGENCYTFKVKSRNNLSSSEKNDIVINEMTTWFNATTMNIVARTYDLSYDAGLYDFDVQMEVKLSPFKDLIVPTLIRYTGNWHVAFKKREQAFFTATLFNFK
jgi:hypothetical protein